MKKLLAIVAVAALIALLMLFGSSLLISKTPLAPQNNSEPQAPTESAVIPTLKQPDIERPQYTMQLELDCDNNRLTGKVNIAFRNDSNDEWESIYLRDFNSGAALYFEETQNAINSSMQSGLSLVKNVQTDSELVWEYYSDPSIVQVIFDSPLAPNNCTELEISFYSDIPYNYDFISYIELDGKNKFFELGNFYPVLAIYEDGEWCLPPFAYQTESFYSLCADYLVTLKLPQDYLVISTGREEILRENGDELIWQLKAENVRDFAITTANNLVRLATSTDSIVLNTYYYEDDPYGLNTRREAELMQESAVAAIRLFQSKIGAYPYDELDVVPSFGEYGGLEYPGLVRISIKAMDFLGKQNSSVRWNERHEAIEKTTAHEVAHQWFYAVIGNDSYNEAWLDESLASFCEKYIYLREITGEQKSDILAEDDRSFLSKWQDNIDPFLDMPVNEYRNFYYSVYMRGSLFLYDIMQLMGEDDFFAMLSDYYAEYSFEQAHTSDFLQILQKHTHSPEVWQLVAQHIKYLPQWAKELAEAV